MKKIALIATLIVAGIGVQGASINWGSNETTYRFLVSGTTDTSSANRLASGSLVALVYLGNATSFTFDDTLGGSYAADNTGISGGTVVDTLNLSAKGRGTHAYENTPYTAMNGNYGMIFFDAASWDDIGEGTKYGITTLVQPIALASEIDNTQTAYLTSNVGLTGTISASSTPPVPEPSTATLALAGLALLLKRRKA